MKKRSWKGGVQVAVEIEHAQIEHAQRTMDFPLWLRSVLSNVPQEDRADYESRAHDILIQQICAVKLGLLLEQGITQENHRVPPERLYEALDQAILAQAEQLKAAIKTELDIEDGGSEAR